MSMLLFWLTDFSSHSFRILNWLTRGSICVILRYLMKTDPNIWCEPRSSMSLLQHSCNKKPNQTHPSIKNALLWLTVNCCRWQIKTYTKAKLSGNALQISSSLKDYEPSTNNLECKFMLNITLSPGVLFSDSVFRSQTRFCFRRETTGFCSPSMTSSFSRINDPNRVCVIWMLWEARRKQKRCCIVVIQCVISGSDDKPLGSVAPQNQT